MESTPTTDRVLKNILDHNITYPEFVAKLTKNPSDIRFHIDNDKINLWHLATGVATEAGELLDAIKKHVIYNKPLDITNVLEELGDLTFYMEGLKQQLNLTEKQIITENVIKLSKRYHSLVYNDQHAQDRADKAPISRPAEIE